MCHPHRLTYTYHSVAEKTRTKSPASWQIDRARSTAPNYDLAACASLSSSLKFCNKSQGVQRITEQLECRGEILHVHHLDMPCQNCIHLEGKILFDSCTPPHALSALSVHQICLHGDGEGRWRLSLMIEATRLLCVGQDFLLSLSGSHSYAPVVMCSAKT